jgi:phosphoribosylglycinamide formyltransferase-1
MKRIVLFASGSGTNAENIILHFNAKNPGTVAAVFSNKPDAKVLDRAKKLNVPTVIFSKEDFATGDVLQKLNSFKPDLIVLAGFLLKFPNNIIQAYPGKIINIHPALLPKYGGKGMYGMHVHRSVIENKETETGISIHFVNEHYDEGNIIFQRSVALTGNETCEEVAEKVHLLEQQYFPQIIEELLTPNS